MDVPVEEITSYIAEAAGKFGVDPKTATAIFYAENMGKGGQMTPTVSTGIRNKESGAIGIMQVMPRTLAALKQQKFLPPDHNMNDWRGQVDAGLAAMSETQRRTGIRDPNFIAAGYEGSPAVAEAFRTGNRAGMPASSIEYQNRFRKGLAMADPQAAQRDVRMTETGTSAPSTAPFRSMDATDAIIASLDSTGIAVKGLMDDMRLSSAEQLAALAVQKQAVVREATARGEATATTGAIDIANNMFRKKLMDIYNLDDKSVDGFISQNLIERKGIEFQRKQLATDIDARMSVGFFDDPLQWFVNQTILPGIVNQHNAFARRENDAVAQMTSLQHQATAQANVDVAANADAMAARTNALVRADAEKANAEVAKIDVQAAGLKSSTALNLAHLLESQDRRTITGFSAIETIAARRERQKIAESEREKVETWERGAKMLSDVIGRTGGMGWKEMSMLGKPNQEAWDKRIQAENTGNNLGESLKFINRWGSVSNIGNQPGRAETAHWIKDATKQVADNAKLIISGWSTDPKRLGQKVPTVEQSLDMAAEMLQNKWNATRIAGMNLADSTNPYFIDHKTLATNFKGDPNNLVYQMVRDAVSKGIEPNDNIILGAVNVAVKSGQVDYRVAAKNISDYYSYGIARNNTARDFKIMGLETQENYIVVPQGSEIPRDLTNSTAMENMLTLQRARNMLSIPGVPDAGLYVVVPGAFVANTLINQGKKAAGFIEKKFRGSGMEFGPKPAGQQPSPQPTSGNEFSTGAPQ